MIEILRNLLNDHVTEGIMKFKIMGIWHLIYLLVILGIILSLTFILKNKSEKTKKCAIAITITSAFVLYMIDFFLMPFAYGYIGIDKLPFHICTTSCLLCFICRHNKFLGKFKTQFVLLGLIGNFIYLFYPAVLDWYGVHAFSYRASQTLMFHGCMAGHGIFSLAFGDVKLEWKKIYKEAIAIGLLVVWSLIGNILYSNPNAGFTSSFLHPGNYITPEFKEQILSILKDPSLIPELSEVITERLNESTYFFNWFFVIQDPFNALPISVSPFVMPFVTFITIFVANTLIYAVYFLVKYLVSIFNKKKNPSN